MMPVFNSFQELQVHAAAVPTVNDKGNRDALRDLMQQRVHIGQKQRKKGEIGTRDEFASPLAAKKSKVISEIWARYRDELLAMDGETDIAELIDAEDLIAEMRQAGYRVDEASLHELIADQKFRNT